MESKKELVYFTINLAYDVGRFLRNSFFTGFKQKIKPDGTVVTDVDLEAEKIIVNRIKEYYPSHSIYGEETVKERGEKTWYIDPIDGTNNFSKHNPFFTTSIGFESPDFSFGVVYSPIIDELYYSDESRAYVNGKPLVSKQEKKSLNNLYLSFCHANDIESRKKAASLLSYFKVHSKELRKFGSTSLEMCYTANNRFDGFIGVNINLWDFKAAYYIAKNSGLYVEELNIKNTNVLLCTKKEVVEELKKKIEDLL